MSRPSRLCRMLVSAAISRPVTTLVRYQWAAGQPAFDRERVRMSQRKLLHVETYDGPEPDLEETRHRFRSIGEGKVSLTKDQDNGIAFIYLDHPEKRNAISGKMMVELSEAVDDLDGCEWLRGVILHSSGSTFCSGGDLTTVRRILSPEGGFAMSCLMHRTFSALSCMPALSVALVQGRALGGGAEVATSCDFRLFAPSGELAFVQARMGLSTGWGGGAKLVSLVGPHLALDLLTSCRAVGVEECLRVGLADGVVSECGKLQECVDWLKKRTAHGASAIRAIKEMVRVAGNGGPGGPSGVLDAERRLFAPLWGGEANLAALNQNIKHRY